MGMPTIHDGTVGHFGQTIGFMSSVTYNPDTNTDLILEQVVSTGTAPTADDVVNLR